MTATSKHGLREEDWELVSALLSKCSKLSELERVALFEKDGIESWLREETLSLLSASKNQVDFLETPCLSKLIHSSAPATDLSTPNLPENLGKYLILEKLGQGGMAEVFLSHIDGPSGFRKFLALKRILPEFMEEPEFRSLFEIEAKLCSRLEHANIVQIYDFSFVEDSYLLAMEYIPGKNLLQFREKISTTGGKLPLEVALYIGLEILKGVEYAHNLVDEKTGEPLRIVHRDLVPANIMISYDGAVKIVDFGIAKARSRVEITRIGQLRGTPRYLSPEVLSNGTVDQRSDVFTLGALLFELIAGKPLFEGGTNEVLHAILKCELPQEKLRELALSSRLKEVLGNALSRDPLKRYENAGSFFLDLKKVGEEEGALYERQQLAELMQNVFQAERGSEIRRLNKIRSLPTRKVPFSFFAKLPIQGTLIMIAIGIVLVLWFLLSTVGPRQSPRLVHTQPIIKKLMPLTAPVLPARPLPRKIAALKNRPKPPFERKRNRIKKSFKVR